MASTQDDAFREIQLSGKQLVFVFMAGVVIAVVIFLIGVQVGRGVLGAAWTARTRRDRRRERVRATTGAGLCQPGHLRRPGDCRARN